MSAPVLILSGGLDSTVLAHSLLANHGLPRLVSFDYGQRHRTELAYAACTAARMGADHTIIDLTGLTPHLRGSALTDPTVAVPEGHYEDETMRATVVPNRNMMMLAIAGAIAVAEGRPAVATAVHAGDHAIYPDCRPAFTEAMDQALRAATAGDGDVALLAPFVTFTKAMIVLFGHAIGVPWEDTWSCYQGGAVHCGRCGTCVERIEAFALAEVADPTVYEAAP